MWYASTRRSICREIMIAKANGTFSADVKLHLYVDDEKFEVGQLGPDFAIFREPVHCTEWRPASH